MALLGPDGQTPVTAPEPEVAEPQPPMQVVTAFVVYQHPNGRWIVTDDLSVPIITMRGVSQDDLISGASNVVAEVSARKAADMAAQTTIQTQLAMARQAQQQAAAQSMTPEQAAAAQAVMTGQVPAGFRR